MDLLSLIKGKGVMNMNMEIINEMVITVSMKLIIFLIGLVFMWLITFIVAKHVDRYIIIEPIFITWIVCLILIFIATISFMIWI